MQPLMRLSSSPHKLYLNTFILLTGTSLLGFGSYLYQILMGNMLSISDFGTLVTLISLFSLIAIPTSAIDTLTTQAVAAQRVQAPGAIRALISKISYKVTLFGIVIFLIAQLAAPKLQQFLNLETKFPYFILNTSIIVLLLLAVYRGSLAGLQRFPILSLNYFIDITVRITTAFFLVTIGLNLIGAVSALALGRLVALLTLLFFERKSNGQLAHKTPISPSPIPRTYIFIFFWTVSAGLLQNIDILFVKHFLPAETTGLYAAMSLLGKIVLWSGLSVAAVFFPLSATLQATGEHGEQRKIFRQACFFLFLLTGILTLTFWRYPYYIVDLFFNRSYLPLARYLPLFGIIGMLISMNQLFAMYYLSKQKKWFVVPVFIAIIIELILIYYRFHSNMLQILIIHIAATSGLFIVFMGGFFVNHYSKFFGDKKSCAPL